MNNEKLSKFLAGFDLTAEQHENGMLVSNSGASISEFPEEITLLGNTFTLEYVEQIGNTEEGHAILSAIYV